VKTTTPVAALAPKSTAVAPVKLVPVMVTLVPPAVVPEVGLTPVTVGADEVPCQATVTALEVASTGAAPLEPETFAT
jgi:hypothetical protein